MRPLLRAGQKVHLLTTIAEHASVLEVLNELVREGATLTRLAVGSDGRLDLLALKKSLRPETALISLAYANNETGIIQPVTEIAKILRGHRAKQNDVWPYFHLDACQAPQFLELKVARLGVDLLTLNGAKLGALGAGLLYVKTGVKLWPIIFGGGQERGWRSGTENVPAIRAFSQALEHCAKTQKKESERLIKLRDGLIKGLLALPGASLNGHPTERLPNNANVTFADVETEQLVLELDAKGVATSSGAACSSNTKTDDIIIKSGLRFTLNQKTTKADLDYVLKILPPIIERLRKFK